EVHRDLDGLVELRLGAVLDQLHRVVERIKLLAIDPFARLEGAFSVRHRPYSPTSMPMERAEPSIIRIAASIVLQLRSFIFCSAISLTCALVTLPTLSRPAALAPDSSFAAFLRKKDTGGVFISNVKERSP